MANIITERAPAPPPKTHTAQGVPLGKGYDRTRLMMLPRNKAADAAHLALFQLQDKPVEEQIMGAAVLFATICNTLGLDPDETHAMGLRVIRAITDEDHTASRSLESLRDFASTALAGRDTTIW
jgi:hypothetical protein